MKNCIYVIIFLALLFWAWGFYQKRKSMDDFSVQGEYVPMPESWRNF